MKPAIAFAFGQLLFGAASACAGGFVPPYHYYNISQNPDVSQDDRDWALFHYNHANNMLNMRQSAPSTGTGENIAPDDDDGQFPLEQNPEDADELQAEEDALVEADQGVPNPDLVEPDEDDPDPAASDDSDTRRRRRRRSINKLTSRIARRQSPVAKRFAYTDQRQCTRRPPGSLARTEGSPVSQDADINYIFDGVGLVDNLFRQVYDRDNQDGAGGAVHGVAHFCYNYANAIWDGVALYFGDGDGRFFKSGGFVRALDVVGHEYTHGVIQFSNPLFYYGQSGALNEHIADVFGVLTVQHSRGQSADQASWLLGEGLINGGTALRSMRAPGTAYRNTPGGSDEQVARMADYYGGDEDDQGVHINSGIPNRAFYLFATAVGGNAWEVPGQVWYDVLVGGRGRFEYRDETFAAFAERTLAAAGELYGSGVAGMLRDAWRQVGVL